MNVGEVLISTAEAAKLLHVSEPTVRRLIADCKLEGFKLGSHWRTSEVACNRYVARQYKNHVTECMRTR